MKKSRYKSLLSVLAPLLIWLMVLSLPFLSRIGDTRPEFRNEWLRTMFLSNILLIVIFYLHSFLIYPLRTRKNGMIIYGLVLFVTLIVFLTGNHFLHPEMPRFPNRGDMPPPSPLMGFLPFAFVIVASFCYRIYMDKVGREEQIKELENLQLKTELEFLSSQISPHFMFNVLNTLVFLARKKSELIEPSLISLSQLMRYMLYESNGSQITLADEIEYLKSYINLQLLRFGDDVRLNLYLSGPFESYRIEPMLLIPFVENAFKHGIGTLEAPIIDISLAIDPEKRILKMEVINGMTPAGIYAAPSSKESGIGLANVKRRLELLYPGRHSFTVQQIDSTFIAGLQINL
ncbi:sensor histidine kinase [Pedobacter metabolipauper]|uniref:Histidine kinase n=1 Tax=Pedobacter metabolipauper TaxID=425513 RepID=A0A4R6SXE1_9SPHI|nr:histidine kinase [Pedobacter metabolipauper]TDQ10106.1 histidine kinase [Pedobacter metabolipauper]